jgi:hypothetical protein
MSNSSLEILEFGATFSVLCEHPLADEFAGMNPPIT